MEMEKVKEENIIKRSAISSFVLLFIMFIVTIGEGVGIFELLVMYIFLLGLFVIIHYTIKKIKK